jgi:peptide/nickel transport system substrate-binding protein
MLGIAGLTLVAMSGCASALSAPTNGADVRGGVLRVVDPTTIYPPGPRPDPTTLDPVLGARDTAELLRCCLGRTLLSYDGEPTSRGGADLRPDLAAALPDVSADGLSWTFHLKRGLHYAPPYQGIEITSADFMRALARVAHLANFQLPFYSVIKGFDDYAAGRSASIAGLETPDPHTLVVRLTQPAGDLGYRLSTPYTAPIPPLRRDPGAALGVYTGHDGGIMGMVVSSGPYMIDGASGIDLEAPVAEQHQPRGFVAGRSITLVRNPSWHASTDPLRPALSDRIVIDFTLDTSQAAAAIDADRADVVMDTASGPQVPAAQVSAYEADPHRGRIEIDAGDGIRYVSMNLAVPPFDDLHVRRAVAYAIDRSALRDAHGGPTVGDMTGHIALDSLEDAALLTFDPYGIQDAGVRLQVAREEMAQSRYDSTHSGRCDSPMCRGVVALTIVGGHHPAAFGAIIHDDLARIGIDLALRDVPGPEFFKTVGDPANRTPMAIGWGWIKDYPSGSDFFTSLFSGGAGFASGANFSVLGATPDQLHRWGYTVLSVPSVDDRVNECVALVSSAQARCWATLDQYMMLKVVPVVPITTEAYVEVIPARVASYSYDQAFDLPALDRIAVPR